MAYRPRSHGAPGRAAAPGSWDSRGLRLMSITHLSDEQLSAHLDGAVDAEVTVHLPGCQPCPQRLPMLRATSQAVGTLPDTAPARPLDLPFLPPLPLAA